MTSLTKPVSRQVTMLTDCRLKPRRKDQYEVTLSPDNSISFRAKGTRKRYTLPLATVYLLAVEETARQERAQKGKKR